MPSLISFCSARGRPQNLQTFSVGMVRSNRFYTKIPDSEILRALGYLQRALRIREISIGHEHPDTAETVREWRANEQQPERLGAVRCGCGQKSSRGCDAV